MKKTAALFILLFVFAAQCAWAAPKRVTLLLDGSDAAIKESYNGQLAEGLQNAQTRFGGKKLTTAIENARGDSSQLQPLLEKAAACSDLVILGSPTYGKYIPAAKKAYPNCIFAAIDFGPEDIHGAVKISFRNEEGGFLAGALAAMLTTHENVDRTNPDKKIGIIMGADIPAVQRFKQGYEAGARFIDSRIQILSENLNDFSNKDKAAAAALRLHNEGADIIFCAAGGASLGAIEAAQRGGYWTIGADAQMETLYPDTVLTSILKLNSHVVYGIVDHFMKNKPFSKDISIGMKEDAIDISTWSRESKKNIPVDVQRRLNEIEEKLIQGLIVIKDLNYQSIN